MSAPAADTLHCPLEIPRDHPAFAGHFPKFPVLPGAVLLDEALQAIQRARGIDVTQWLASVKFLDAVSPGDVLRLEHDVPQNGLIRFTIRTGNRTVASGSLASAARHGARRPSDAA